MPRAKKTVSVEELARGEIYEEKETPPALPLEVTPPVTESVTKSPEDKKPAMVQLRLTAMYIRPDTREFRQNSAELQPSGWGVAVDVPNTPEMFAAENMLTPKGLVFVQWQLEQPYLDWKKSQPATSEDAEEPWEEDEKKETTKASATEASDDEWGDESKSSTEKKPEETWDETKDEDWK